MSSSTAGSPNKIDEILKRRAPEPAQAPVEDATPDELESIDTYRPLLAKSRAQFAFVVVEADGTEHGFSYPMLRHPKLQFIDGEELLSFSADGIAVVLQGRGLRAVMRNLRRHTLIEMREHDGKMPVQGDVCITRIQVKDTQASEKSSRPRLVK